MNFIESNIVDSNNEQIYQSIDHYQFEKYLEYACRTKSNIYL